MRDTVSRGEVELTLLELLLNGFDEALLAVLGQTIARDLGKEGFPVFVHTGSQVGVETGGYGGVGEGFGIWVGLAEEVADI